MLAVKSRIAARTTLVITLKLEQRKRVLDQAIKVMTWTVRSAAKPEMRYFNFAKLGVIADQYYVDFYGSDAASFLHRNGTDRLWVSWHLDTDRVTNKLEGAGQALDLGRRAEAGNGRKLPANRW
jgi:predicted GNAT superfamily acetyltransferase